MFTLPVLPNFKLPNKEVTTKVEISTPVMLPPIKQIKSPALSLKLLPHQIEHFKRISNILTQHFSYLDTSETGCGKTFVALQLAKIYNYKLFVVVPKGVCSVWKTECSNYGINLIEAMSYEKLRGTTKQINPNRYVIRRGSQFMANNYFKTLVKEKILLIFDEVHRLKNRKTASLAAAHCLVKEIVKFNCGSRVACLSASPFDKAKHAFSLMIYSRRIDSILADRLLGFMVNRGRINKASFKYFQRIIKNGLSSSMPRPKIESNFDAKNGYYIMSPEDDKLIIEGAKNLAAAVRFNPDIGRVARETPNFSAIIEALMMIERGKMKERKSLGSFKNLIIKLVLLLQVVQLVLV